MVIGPLRFRILAYFKSVQSSAIDRRKLGVQPGNVPSIIIEKRLRFHQLLPPLAPNILVALPKYF